MPPKIKIGKVGQKSDLPAGLVSVIYYCLNCQGKHTYGSDFFVEVGAPSVCPNCGTVFNQDDQIHRFETDSDEDLSMRRDDLKRSRGETVEVEVKPDSPEKIKQAQIDSLQQQLDRLKGKSVPGIRLGP